MKLLKSLKYMAIGFVLTFIVLILGSFIFICFKYGNKYNEDYSNMNYMKTALHESGHAVVEEYYFPNTVKSIVIHKKPNIFKFIKLNYKSKYDGIELGVTNIKELISENSKENDIIHKIAVDEAGVDSTKILFKDKKNPFAGMFGGVADDENAQVLVKLILKREGFIQNINVDLSKLNKLEKTRKRIKEIYDDANKEAETIIRKKQRKIKKLAKQLLETPSYQLNGNKIRTIINAK